MINIYNIDWQVIIKIFVPSLRRKPKTLAVIGALTTGLKNLYNDFISFRESAIYKASHNASVISLEKVMNDHFDETQRRIYIKNVTQNDSIRFYPVAMQQQVGFYPLANGMQVAFNASADYSGAADFLVYLPIDIQPGNQIALEGLLIKMRTQLNYYKLFSKNYEFVWTN